MARSVNTQRGEVALTLGQTTYHLRPTFEALVSAEEEIGSLLSLMERASRGDIGIKDITVLLHACALAGGHDIARETFANALLQQGIGDSAGPLRAILGSVMGGDGSAD